MRKATRQPSPQTLLTFQVGERWFAVPLATVEGTGSLPSITALPGNTSRVFLGLSYVLGQLMSVVDIAPLFNLGSRLPAKDLLILKHEGYYYALIVSVIGEILTRPIVRPVRTMQNDAVLGATVQKKRRVLVLDVPALITRRVCS